MAHPKGVLIERLQKEGRQPHFDTRRSGPDHEPVFDADVVVDDEVLGSGRGPNKRAAERRAAEEALLRLDEGPDAPYEDDDDEAPAAEPEAVAPAAPSAAPDEEAFEGPWPIFDDVLAAALHVANDRVDASRRDDEAREAIEAFALALYKGVLQDLGDVVELDD